MEVKYIIKLRIDFSDQFYAARRESVQEYRTNMKQMTPCPTFAYTSVRKKACKSSNFCVCWFTSFNYKENNFSPLPGIAYVKIT